MYTSVFQELFHSNCCERAERTSHRRNVRQSDSIRILRVNSNLCDNQRPAFNVLYDRYTDIVHTKLRHNCALNSDYFDVILLTVRLDHVV